MLGHAQLVVDCFLFEQYWRYLGATALSQLKESDKMPPWLQAAGAKQDADSQSQP